MTAGFWNGRDGPSLVWAEHVVADSHADVSRWPCTDNVCQGLRFQGNYRLIALSPETLSVTLHAYEIDCQLKGIAATFRFNFVSAFFEDLAGNRPTVTPEQRENA